MRFGRVITARGPKRRTPTGFVGTSCSTEGSTPRRWAHRPFRRFSPGSPSSAGSVPRRRTRHSARCCFSTRTCSRIEVGAVPPVVRARTPERLPVVLSRDEMGAILKQLEGTARLIVMLLYGSSVRLEECLELRVKDLDFDRHPDHRAARKGPEGPPASFVSVFMPRASARNRADLAFGRGFSRSPSRAKFRRRPEFWLEFLAIPWFKTMNDGTRDADARASRPTSLAKLVVSRSTRSEGRW